MTDLKYIDLTNGNGPALPIIADGRLFAVDMGSKPEDVRMQINAYQQEEAAEIVGALVAMVVITAVPLVFFGVMAYLEHRQEMRTIELREKRYERERREREQREERLGKTEKV